jgi:hypothetical protein
MMIDLAAPLGQPGSGRQRYAAAMALHRDGLIGDRVLEVYRIAAARDGDDPLDLLAGAGLPVPACAAPPNHPLVRLVAAVDTYLATLPGPGVAEVRGGMAAVGSSPLRAMPGKAMAVVDTHMAPALAALWGRHPGLAIAIADAAPLLRWKTYDGYPPDQIGADFAVGHAFATLVGGDGPFAADDFDLGLFLIAPHVLYRDHHHAAPELYAPLTGPHGWRFGPGQPLVIQPAHQPVWNPPHRPHLTKVGPVPFLCLFGWTRDVHALAQVIPADDWTALEVLRLG